MAIKRYIPIQDTYIVSASAELNFGADEILKIGKCEDSETTGSARTIVKFEDIENLPDDFRAVVHLSLAEAYNLPPEYLIIAHTLEESWVEGFGRNASQPPYPTGATWKFRDEKGNTWKTPGGDSGDIYDGKFALNNGFLKYLDGKTATVLASYKKVSGGNAWGIDSGEAPFARVWAQTFVQEQDEKDIDIDVTDMVKAWKEHTEGSFGLRI